MYSTIGLALNKKVKAFKCNNNEKSSQMTLYQCPQVREWEGKGDGIRRDSLNPQRFPEFRQPEKIHEDKPKANRKQKVPATTPQIT